MTAYAHLYCTTNYTFLTGASHPHEFVYQAAELGYDSIAITDECSLAGIVKAFVAAEELEFKLIVGSRFTLSNGMRLIAIAPTRIAYAELSGFITLARRRSAKGEYEAHFDDLRFRLQHCLIIWLGYCGSDSVKPETIIDQLHNAFKDRLWIGINHQWQAGEQASFKIWLRLARKNRIPLVACSEALMHQQDRKPLQDVLTAIRHNKQLNDLGTDLISNAEAYLKPVELLERLYSKALLDETCRIADQCIFSMKELRYQYPRELVPEAVTPIQHLRHLVCYGKKIRWPKGVPQDAEALLEKELTLIEEVQYEYYFLTVHDLVRFARSQGILCQGRGSAANSVVCYCLFVTEIAPGQINVLFERFISQERDEPPDIDIDFEHERREEVIQYIYQKYGRERAAIAATVITYGSRSAVRDIGKALGLDNSLLDYIAENIAWWDRHQDLHTRLAQEGLQMEQKTMQLLCKLVGQLLNFPRHLSQHVGGFVISETKVSDLVPIENASMENRTVIQWDKTDLESMRLLKVDVLGLGMLTTLRKTLEYIHNYNPAIQSLADIPREDPLTYDMLCKADTIGLFQVESRAQIAMLPRLQPRCFYDLVIQIAIVRPGPIQGDMVHPLLRRRTGQEEIAYASEAIKSVLEPTMGVPIFQEQVMRLSIVAAGFTASEADQLRRAMAAWGKNNKLLLFEEKFINGLLRNGYALDFAQRLFEQIKGFGGYGFPESHSASFALLCYASAWLKRHHPAAFYCALLNSQPLGFYSPAQLIQDAKRHHIDIFPVDINYSFYDYNLEKNHKDQWGIRMGFREVRSLNKNHAESIAAWRGDKLFTSLEDVTRRTKLSAIDLQCLASADVFHNLVGNRHLSRWQAAGIELTKPLLETTPTQADDLFTKAPTTEKNIITDYQTLGYSLRQHPMELLRNESPFNRCMKCCDLIQLPNKGFVRIAGLVTCHQRPGTANGTMFLTIEDETGNINVIVWKSTQDNFRKELLTAKLLVIKGTLEIANEYVTEPVIHVVAGHLEDYSERFYELDVKSRDFR